MYDNVQVNIQSSARNKIFVLGEMMIDALVEFNYLPFAWNLQ